MGTYGFQPALYGPLYSAVNVPTPPAPDEEGFQLVSDDPHAFVFGYWHSYMSSLITYRYERTDVRVEVGQPWREKYQDIEYRVEQGDTMTLVKGEVWVYYVDVTFSVVSKDSSGIYVFKDTPVWTALVTTVWDRAVADPATGVEGRAWGAPISAYIEYYRVGQNSGDHYAVEPSYQGRFVTLYGEPSSQGTTIGDLGVGVGASVNSTLQAESPLSPDSRMRSTAYARFILADFGVTANRDLLGTITQKYHPSVNYRLKVYYLSVGKWVFTKDQAETWTEREGDLRSYGWFASWLWFWDSVFQGLGALNPFRAFGAFAGVAAFIALALVGLAALYIVVKVLGQSFLKRIFTDH